MNSVGYTRVSTEEQAISGLSLSNQEEKIDGYGKLHDLVIAKIISDPGQSGATMDRPGLQSILKMVRRREIAAIVILKLDRLSRSQKHILELIELFDRYQVRLISVQESLDTTTASGRFVVSLLGSLSQLEREVIGERTQSAIGQLRREKRRFTHHAPLGWRFDGSGKMIKHDSEQKVVRVIHELHSEGLSLRKIGEELLGRGMSPRNGSAWSTSVIRNAIRSASE
ncbi:MAG: recombinase family protein [Candidatus Omnitrophica bacterium]|nr:recombinase family protein [Candidatus Omnitrophota bacterium]